MFAHVPFLCDLNTYLINRLEVKKQTNKHQKIDVLNFRDFIKGAK